MTREDPERNRQATAWWSKSRRMAQKNKDSEPVLGRRGPVFILRRQFIFEILK